MFKKVASAILAMAMFAGLSVPAFAIARLPGDTTDITIDGPTTKDGSSPQYLMAVPAQIAVPISAELPEDYTVKAGDTLGLIALNNYGSYSYWEELYAVNADVIKNTKKGQIYEGLVIALPETIGKDIKRLSVQTVGEDELLYTIKTGDSLSGISYMAYNKDSDRVKEIVERNFDRIAANKTLYEGQTIVLPVVTAR